MTQRDELSKFIIELVGSSLRHSFRTPLSIIVNALREVEAELKSARSIDPRRVESITSRCKDVYRLRTEALAHYQSVGESLKQDSALPNLEQTMAALSAGVEPRLREIRRIVLEIRSRCGPFANPAVDNFSQIASLEVSRALKIYEGILKLLQMPSDFKLQESVSIWGRLDVAAAQIRRNFELTPVQVGALRLPKRSSSIEGSRALIDLLFLNVLENAVRYALRAGTFSVRVTIEDLDHTEAYRRHGDYLPRPQQPVRWIEITFLNSGAPVPAGRDQDIFRIYWTSEEPSERSTGGGSGIGLALAKLIAEMHGGVIYLDRRYTEETAFTLLLPADSSE